MVARTEEASDSAAPRQAPHASKATLRDHISVIVTVMRAVLADR